MAGELQNRKPRVCEKCKPGVFGSQFVTICVTGETTLYFFTFYEFTLLLVMASEVENFVVRKKLALSKFH